MLKKIVAVTTGAGLGALVAFALPDIRRYLRIRAM